ncbi:dTDP-4-dehydrorhamnose reductase [Hydrogenophaga sp. UC242_50]|jgi:dTDP-4-dehydrorhamnose reductase|uniref:dTDP-4-dehydrorhamnose reductase n=1 Tax=unclassified Hydrogenophaga TaxID=2610897 RepID=UPI0036D2ACF4
MKILLLGKNGQIGWELQRSLAPLGELVALDRHSTEADGGCGDLARPDALRETVQRLRPHVIVNAAAHTAVERAESEPGLAHTVNTVAPGALADAAHTVGALLVHYSTDYVFDGSGHLPWREDAATAPLSVYGTTKRDGENLVRASGARHLILRTSWVYAARGGNFARTMLRLAQEREHLTVIDDQWGAPTGAELIADVTAHAMRQVLREPACAGTYHLSAAGETSWNGYARFVFDTARALHPALPLKVQDVAPVPSSAFATAARRPLNSRLDTTRLCDTFGLALPHWQLGVRRMLAEILGPTGTSA